MALSLRDRRGGTHSLVTQAGDTVAAALTRNSVPPPSVLVFRADRVVCDDHVLDPAGSYVAQLIEGYDIVGIRHLYDSRDSTAAYLRRQLRVAPTGALRMERVPLDPVSTAAHVERVVGETIDTYDLLGLDGAAPVVLGLSGGVDSGSLLMLLAAYRDTHPAACLEIRAATFQDFDSRWSETFDFAARLAQRCGVEHDVVEAERAEHVFHLNRPVAQILMHLMETDDAPAAMYVDHHATRRVLEVYADQVGSHRVALGLHTTDLLAGLLNSYTSGFDVGPVPRRPVGPYTYLLPLAFVPKRELHLYYTERTGHAPKQTVPNQWEFNPSDRNFYYYLADSLQWLWPGIETWMFTAHAAQAADLGGRQIACENCGGTVLAQPGRDSGWSGVCDVCAVLDKYGWIHT
jgi:tRNA(Ile)-lysidine synthase TilS/MesJ